MGSRIDPLEKAKAEFMFGLLGYSTWNVYLDKEFVGQVTLNEADRTAFFTAEGERPEVTERFMLRSWAWWMSWLRHHRHEPF